MSTPEDRYDEYLDDLDPQWLVESYSVSRILKEVDPIAYRVGFSDWEDENVCPGEDCENAPSWRDSDNLCPDCAEEKDETDEEERDLNDYYDGSPDELDRESDEA